VSGRLGPGVAVLVIGPTLTGGLNAMGRLGCIERRVADGDSVGPAFFAAGNGWLVTLDRPVAWGSFVGTTRVACFPATSLMPLEGNAEPEATPTAADQPQPVEA
jgi:hypothetical protein